MTVDQILLQEIKDTEVWLSREKEESVYQRDLKKRIELIGWVLENMKNPNIRICELMESKLSEIILKINQTHDVFAADRLDSEIRILDWIFYQVCKDQHKMSTWGLPMKSVWIILYYVAYR